MKKTSCFAIVLLVSTTLGICGQIAATRNPVAVSKGAAAHDTPLYTISESGPHHRVWQKTVSTTNRLGQTITSTNQAYVELATGLNYWDPVTRQWTEAKEEIETYPGGAVARHGQHRVIFAHDLATAGAIDMQTPDGKRMRSHILGLSYFDTVSGQSVLIAEVTNSLGVVVPPNQVLYQDAFTDFKADVLYTYTRAGFEQDIILRERPPLPEAFGLDSRTTHLQILTEFLSPPQPAVRASKLPSGARDGISLTDETLDFGVMSIGRGKAFVLEHSEHQPTEEIPVAKQWLLLEGRQVLVEEVTIPAAAKQLDTLPLPKEAGLGRTKKAVRRTASIRRQLPAPRLVQTASTNRMEMAKLTMPLKGFVLDYVTMTSQSNYTFQGDTTYYLSGTVNLTGTNNVIEGGAVLKYTNNASLSISVAATTPAIQFRTSAYRPAIFTSMHDNSVGETITGSTGNPTNYYANPALNFIAPAFPPNINYFRIACAKQAISLTALSPLVSDGQIVNCQIGIYANGAGGSLENVLFAGVLTNCSGSGGGFQMQNVTFGNSSYVLSPGASFDLSFTNCIFANVTNLYSGTPHSFGGDHNGFYNSPSFGTGIVTNTFNPFQSAGAGNYYLTNGCSFLNAGTTSIDATLLADLKIKTTYPPIAYTNITASGTWTIQALRDTDTPDLGFHYDPIDYAVSGATISNSLTLGNGVTIGAFYVSGSAFTGGSGTTFSVLGTAQTHNHICSFQAVQEQPVKWGYTPSVNILSPGTALVEAHFTEFDGLPGLGSVPAPNSCILAGTTSQLILRDCRFGPGILYCDLDTSSATSQCVNNLFERAQIILEELAGSSPLGFYNNTVRNSATLFNNVVSPVDWIARDNFFENSTWYFDVGNGPVQDHNAYLNTSQLTPTNASDIVLTSFTYTNGPLGNYYQFSTGLTNKGSRTADLAGLYHYTTQASQVKETNSIVDIGFHYVAVDANGNPIDTDGDGIPDYLEDANGNGSVNSGETDWQSSTDLGLKVFITRPKNNSVIP